MPTLTVDPNRLFELVGRRFGDDVFMTLGLEAEYTPDGMLKIEYNRNRPDMSGITGIARAIKGILEIELGLPSYKLSEEIVCTLNGRARGREHIAAAVVEFDRPINDVIVSELIEMQELICNTYGRRRELIAIGLHDFDKIKCPITYTNGDADTQMIPLNETEPKTLSRIIENTEQGNMYGHLGKTYPILIDASGTIIAYPPVINSEVTRLKPGVKRIFVDVTGTREDLVKNALEIIVANMLEYGGKAYRMKVNGELFPSLSIRKVMVNPTRASSISGVPISIDEFVRGLERMRLGREEPNALVPSYRTDIMGPIDVIENALIGYGINNIAAHAEKPPSVTVGRVHPMTSLMDYLRELAVGLGFIEVIGPSLVNSERYIEHMKMPASGYIVLENPISKEHDMLRSQLLPVLLRILSKNKNNEYPQRIFELGEALRPSGYNRLLGLASAHSKASYSEIKGYVEAILRALGFEELQYEIIEKPYYIPGRSARIVVNGIAIGEMGEVHPEVLRAFELYMPVVAAELNVTRIYELITSNGGSGKTKKG